MIGKPRVIFLLALASLTLISACGGDEPTRPPVAGPLFPTPDIEATVQARVRSIATAQARLTPTPTPPPSEARGVVVAFATGHAQLSTAWERFHQDFDAWRQGNVACEARSVETTLRGFAQDFTSITGQARQLPRSPSLKGVADTVIQAAEKEETALRQLRNTWQPNDPAAFEAIEEERSAAAALLLEAGDNLAELQTRSSQAIRRRVQAFLGAHTQLNGDWDQFHRSYETFRAEESTLDPQETLARLHRLVARFSDISIAARDLEAPEVVRPLKGTLIEAAENEELALRKLRDSFQNSPSPASPSPSPTPKGKDEDATPTEASAPTNAFAVFDTQLVEANRLRRQVLDGLNEVLSQTSESSEAEVAEFATKYDSLAQALELFHQGFDNWRKTEGGCDRVGSVKVLGQFVIRFGGLSSKVKALPQAIFLQPLGELFIEAAVREDRALSKLREEWQPFDTSALRTFDQERSNADRLRRQVAAGLNGLSAQFDISAREIKE